jgi:hypothetical protein
MLKRFFIASKVIFTGIYGYFLLVFISFVAVVKKKLFKKNMKFLRKKSFFSDFLFNFANHFRVLSKECI